MKLVIASMILTVAALAAACGGGTSCDDAVGNGLRLAGMGGAQYGNMRASVVKLCHDEKWSEKTRACLAAAKDKAAVEKCPQERDTDKQAGGAEEYARKSKASEAELELKALEKRLKSYYAENATFPTGTVPPTPAQPCCATGGKCKPAPSTWAQGVWGQLDFSIDDPHYFQYSYTSAAGTSAKATATGDLDCDGATIEYVLELTVVDGNPSATLTKPTTAD